MRIELWHRRRAASRHAHRRPGLRKEHRPAPARRAPSRPARHVPSSATAVEAPAKPHHGLLPRARDPLSAYRSPPTTAGPDSKPLRARWASIHITSSRCRPVLIIDEAQGDPLHRPLCELRILASKDLDSKQLLCVVFAGDARLPERLRSPDPAPSRLPHPTPTHPRLRLARRAARLPRPPARRRRKPLAHDQRAPRHPRRPRRRKLPRAHESSATSSPLSPPTMRGLARLGTKSSSSSVFAQAPQDQAGPRRTQIPMTPSELHRLLIAPEIIVVDLALAALRALDRALLAEHPRLHAPPDPADSLVQRRARLSSSDSPPDSDALCATTATSSTQKSSPTPTSPITPSDPRPSAFSIHSPSRFAETLTCMPRAARAPPRSRSRPSCCEAPRQPGASSPSRPGRSSAPAGRHLRTLAPLAVMRPATLLDLGELRRHRRKLLAHLRELCVLGLRIGLPAAVVLVVGRRGQHPGWIRFRAPCRSRSCNRSKSLCSSRRPHPVREWPHASVRRVRTGSKAAQQHRELRPVEHDPIGSRRHAR